MMVGKWLSAYSIAVFCLITPYASATAIGGGVGGTPDNDPNVIDSDGDGIVDAADACVYEPGTISNYGCPPGTGPFTTCNVFETISVLASVAAMIAGMVAAALGGVTTAVGFALLVLAYELGMAGIVSGIVSALC